MPDDAVASDFLPGVAATHVVRAPKWLKRSLSHYNKRAGHLTYERGRGLAIWHLGHAYWLVIWFGLFLDRLRVANSERAKWFEEAHDYAIRVSDGLKSPYVESALETPIGGLFFKEWPVHPTLSFEPPKGEGPEHLPPPRFPDLIRWRPQA